MMDWIDSNHEVLMVFITFIYVVATILICYFNAKSAKASRDQINASQKQQKQNAELQLYSMRRDVINKIAKRQYADALWDVQLLFNERLFYECAEVGQEEEKLRKLEIEIDWFEKELGVILPATKLAIVTSKITIASTQKNYEDLDESIKQALEGIKNNELAYNAVDEFVKNLQCRDSMSKAVQEKTFQLILELSDYIKKSIAVEKSEVGHKKVSGNKNDNAKKEVEEK